MIDDPDYARAFTKIRCLAWSHGWCAVLHGSGTRDLDVLLAPWEDSATEPSALIRHMASTLDMEIPHEPREKPHGRVAWTLMFKGFGDPRWIDLSVMPRLKKEAPCEPPTT